MYIYGPCIPSLVCIFVERVRRVLGRLMSAANCLNAHLLGWFRFMCGFTELPEYGELLQFPSNFRSALENVSAAVAANVSCHAANEREN